MEVSDMLSVLYVIMLITQLKVVQPMDHISNIKINIGVLKCLSSNSGTYWFFSVSCFLYCTVFLFYPLF